MAYTLNDSLPKANIIRELERNIQKYRGETITDKDILNISTRISSKQLKNIGELNKIADKDSSAFIEKLKVEAELQQRVENERIERFEELYKKFQDQVSTLQKAKSQVESKEVTLKEKSIELEESKRLLDIEKELEKDKINNLSFELEKERKLNDKLLSDIKEKEKQSFIDLKLARWRRSSWIQLSICMILIILVLLYISYLGNWEFDETMTIIESCKANFLIAGLATFVIFVMTFFVLRNLREKYYNQSNIKAFKEMIKYPK